MRSFSTTTRLTIGLCSLSITVWMVASQLGFIRDDRQAVVAGRVALCEQAAVQCSLLAQRNDVKSMKTSLQMLASRNPQVRSVALRRANGSLLVEIGEHVDNWTLESTQRSTDSQMRVPIMCGNREWSKLEMCYAELNSGWWANHPTLTLLVFCGAASYLAFYLYMHRVLRQLDPSKAIPFRVRAALDTFAEGVIVLDKEQRIVLANRAFADAVKTDESKLIGRCASELPWNRGADAGAGELPWSEAVRDGKPQIGRVLSLGKEKQQSFFSVNACPIVGNEGQQRGTLASFNDITAIENNKANLAKMLQDLKHSHTKISQQNQELHILATRDPLTGCLNRRSFFQEFGRCWKAACDERKGLSCVMVDIDHFKSINDTHGHSVGDEVLSKVGAALLNSVKEGDLVVRYGGEEFSVVLPQTEIEQATAIAERLRIAISELQFSSLSVTASLGVSSLQFAADSVQDLIDQADQALYAAKHGGRNQVVRWDRIPPVTEAAKPEKIRREQPADKRTNASANQIPYPAVTSLLAALAYRDPDTAAHSTRVADLCVTAARALMSVHEAYVLEVAALLHDIGKIGVPDAILLKPGPLTREEWEVMKLHDRIGCEIVNDSFNCQPLSDVIRYHHFSFRGDPASPNTLRGEDIPLGARILTIADAFDAMVSDRVYRPGRSADAAFEELRRCAGIQFDPKLVEHFITTIRQQSPHRHPQADRVSRQMALQIGIQAEKLAQAVDKHDFDAVKSLAYRLGGMAAKNNIEPMRLLAEQLQAACTDDPDLKPIIEMTQDLIDICRAAQRAHIDIHPQLGIAPATSRWTVLESNPKSQPSSVVVGGRMAAMLNLVEESSPPSLGSP